MKKTYKIIIAVLCIPCVLYLGQRFFIKKDIKELCNKYPIKYDYLLNDDFKQEISFLNDNTFLTNSELKEKREIISKAIENESCIKQGIQLKDEDINENVDSFIKAHSGISVGKIFIYTKENNKYDFDKNLGYIDCSVYTYGLSEESIIDKDAKIKIRGNSTSYAPKKPYNIKFSEKHDLYGFGEAKKWCLLADAYDPTMLRNRVFLDFAREMNLKYTSNCDYVEVWFDNEYIGCYLLAEAVEVGKNRVDIDIDNGDFLIEYEAKRSEEGVSYIWSHNAWRFALSEPEEPDEETLKYIEDKINQFNDIAYAGDYNELEKIIDVDSFAKLYLLNEYAKTVDFNFSSVNFYYKDGKFYAGPAWDFDLSSGNADLSNNRDYWMPIKNGDKFEAISYADLWAFDNKVYAQLMQYPEFVRKVEDVFNKYSEYINSLYAENGIIDSLQKEYGKLIDLNYSKNNNGAKWGFMKYDFSLEPFETYKANVDYFKKWLENRYLYLNEQFSND